MHFHITLTIIFLSMISLIEYVKPDDEGTQNDTIIKATTPIISSTKNFKKYGKTALWMKKIVKTNNSTNNRTMNSNTPPSKLFYEYLRCRHLASISNSTAPYSCPYDFEENTKICWKPTNNGTYASSTIEYNHDAHNSYDEILHGIENCTIERFCQNDGTWAMTISPDIQCKICIGGGRPVTFDSISIIIETVNLCLSLISLTIAVLCMINIKRLHLPRNLLHMNLFVAFIFRSIIKLLFIHLIVGGYARTMITYTYDKCGNIEILSKSSSLFHVIGCRTLSSLFWYTDAISQTFIFCEAMFLFTALTSHLFRDRSCLVFVLWGWLSPLIWLTMWIVAHILTDIKKNRSTCWLEADHTTYFYYIFYVPYAFYLFINFLIFIYLVRLLYSKYTSNTARTNKTGNRHLIKSILILIPLFGLHSLFVMWVFYRKDQGHTISYFIVVIFKAIFGDLQGLFTSLIYFYFNTEIRHEVIRQIQRSLLNKLNNDAVRRSSAGDTFSTRLSVFGFSFNRRQRSSTANQNERNCSNNKIPLKTIKVRGACWQNCLQFICPCLYSTSNSKEQQNQKCIPIELNDQNVNNNNNNNLNSVKFDRNLREVLSDDDLADVTTTLLNQNGDTIENEGETCDTILVMKNENNMETNPTAFTSNDASPIIKNNIISRTRSKSDGCDLWIEAAEYHFDNRSLK